MSELNQLKQVIKEEMQTFEPFFKARLKTDIALLDIITTYIIRRKGKQIRPMLVFLSARLNGTVTEATHVAASLIEILHTATLIHDDVVDETYQRRGFFSINALWKSKIAVLVGDFYLSKGLLTALDYDQVGVLKLVSQAVKAMSEGELLQIEKSRKLDITESIYFDIIRKKTASLLASCTASGALTSGADNDHVENMKLFGENLGIAFQIRDDLFDYERNGIIGKPTGNDLKEKKMTLPIIYVLNNATSSEKRELLRTIRKHHKENTKIQKIISLVEEKGGLDYAREKMMEYKNRAIDCLTIYPDSDVKTSMIQLVDYVIERSK